LGEIPAGFLPKEETVEEVDGRAHGADIGAEKTPDEKGCADKDQGPENPEDDFFPSQDRAQAQKRVKTEVQIGGKPIRHRIRGQKEEGSE